MSIEGGKKVVLAIDDVSMNLSIIKNLLSKYFDVRMAKSGEIALFILGSVKVDLILLDIEMPGMSGFDFINVMQELPGVRDIPVIFVTSHATPSIISKASQLGAKGYIVKPLDVEVLRSKVFSTLDMHMPD